MILSSTSPYALLKEFPIACGFKYDARFFAFVQIIYFLDCRTLATRSFSQGGFCCRFYRPSYSSIQITKCHPKDWV